MSAVVTGGALLNLNKPRGITSRDAVNRVQRMVRPAKVGHAGTLDPLASGLLVIAIGSATRLVEFVQQLPKSYRATFLLGRHSTTEDVEGEITELADARVPTHDELAAAATRLTGDILQRPPVFSAIKIGGRRSYKLARQGKPPDLAPRPVTIHRFALIRYDYPELEVEIDCSSGTYVRSLGRDLAESLGTAATMSALVRTAIGNFRLEDSIEFDRLDVESLQTKLLPLKYGVEHLTRIELSDEDATEIRFGRTIKHVTSTPGSKLWAGFDRRGELVAILDADTQGVLAPNRVFPASD